MCSCISSFVKKAGVRIFLFHHEDTKLYPSHLCKKSFSGFCTGIRLIISLELNLQKK